MKATRIVRRIDDLGRVVILKEIRRTMRIREGESLEMKWKPEGRFSTAIHNLVQRLHIFKRYAIITTKLRGYSSMRILNFFKKWIQNNVFKTTVVKSECHNKQEDKARRTHFAIAEKIQASTPKYKTIEDVIDILQNNGFAIKYIETYGEFSAHDCTDSFKNKYRSVDEFKQKVYDDFNEHKERIKGAAVLTWSGTFFKLYHENLNFDAVISMGEDNGKDEPQEAYLFIRKENMDIEDEEYLAKLVLGLHPFIAPKQIKG